MTKRYFSVIFRNIPKKYRFVTEKWKEKRKSIIVQSEEKEEKKINEFLHIISL